MGIDKEDTSKENSEYSFNESYRKWRTIQREQLGISANICMLFSSASLGFMLNYLITNKTNICCCLKTELFIGCCFMFLSLSFYAIFTINRLTDFRKTGTLFKNGKNEIEVERLTKKKGEATWYLYILQIIFLFIGTILLAIGVFSIIL